MCEISSMAMAENKYVRETNNVICDTINKPMQ